MRREPLAASLSIALIVAGAAALLPDDPQPEWRLGPVRYILTVKEDADYKKLASDEERRSFIEAFWAALDPTPGTEVNERRAEFWRRVEGATRLFPEDLLQGWKSERGKMYILLGPPDERKEQGIGEIWIYRNQPDPEAPPEIRLEFHRMMSGQYHIVRKGGQGRPDELLQYDDPLARADGEAVGDTFLSVAMGSGKGRMLRDRIRMPEFPLGEVRADYFLGSLEGRARFDLYKAEDRTARVALTLSVPAALFRSPDGSIRPPDLRLEAAIVEAATGKAVQHLSESLRVDPWWSEGAGGPLLFRSGFNVVPGAYRVEMALFDPQRHLGTKSSQTIEVPDFGKGFGLSSVALGRPAAPGKDAPAPIRQGSIALAPDPEAAFLEGETLAFAYQVYNARHRRGAADLRVEYRFFIETPEGPRPAGKPLLLPHLTGESLAYDLPLRGWPAAAYLLRVQVTDLASGAVAAREARFRVLAPPTSPSPPPPTR